MFCLVQVQQREGVNMDDRIKIHHGSGGQMMRDLIRDTFIKYFDNKILRDMNDSAVIRGKAGYFAFTTDSYVVDPLFFPGGDIGKIAVCGTVNDLSVSGAIPQYLSASFIIEEGFPLDDLIRIIRSMAKEARNAKVRIVTGDTKVLPKGKADKLFINTSGVGFIKKEHCRISQGGGTKPGDLILINGPIGDHGISILNARESFNFVSGLTSDCASLNKFIQQILANSGGVRFMRDATRGGLAAVLCEFAEMTGFGIDIDEANIPVREEVRGLCELLGFEPLHQANEGKVVIVAGKRESSKILDLMQRQKDGKGSAIIGRIVSEHPSRVRQFTTSGGSRWVDLPFGEQLPRIC
jgi:hydrogenase expression/formation protein HypE